MKFHSGLVALGLSIFTSTAVAIPSTKVLSGKPLSEKPKAVTARDTSVQLTFLNAENTGVWVDIPLDTGYISPINLNGLVVSTIPKWTNFDTVWCAFWDEYPDVTKPSLAPTYDAQDITHFNPATQITYIQCCNGDCPDWAAWGSK